MTLPHDADAPLVSVIIPVYNGEQFLRRCLDSVLGQSMPDLELIAVNDGSTDASLEILREYAARDPRVIVVDQANAGQGAARNRALDLARGEYVLFVDADDFIERVTLQVTTERAEEDRSDLVHFDWKLYDSDRPGWSPANYYNLTPYWGKRELRGEDCAQILKVKNLYAWNSLYRRSFLNRYGIRFEEGRIYEDNPFVLRVALEARNISLLQSPLYTLNPHNTSTTRVDRETDRHYLDHVHAMRRSFELVPEERDDMVALLAAYHFHKYQNYYRTRVPRRYREAYAKEFVEILHTAGVSLSDESQFNRFFSFCVGAKFFERRRVRSLRAVSDLKQALMPGVRGAKARLRELKLRFDRPGPSGRRIRLAQRGPVSGRTIVFLGLDYRYTGNSRFLYERIIDDPEYAGFDIYFVTRDARVADPRRLSPGTETTNATIAAARIVIAESWIPESLSKHPDAQWIQLWHGAPLKRLLFDAPETEIQSARPRNKLNKFRDIQRWDYLVADRREASVSFETAFLYPRERFLEARYPRVEYLREQDVSAARLRLRERLLPEGAREKTVVLYAPTWRDRNYGKGIQHRDRSHLLDIRALSAALGDEFVFLFHDHDYLQTSSGGEGTPSVIDASGTEIQDLLLASDVVLTDYSSVVFDAQEIGRRIGIYAVDLEDFMRERGLYARAWLAFGAGAAGSPDELVQTMRRGPSGAEPSRIEGFSASLLDRLRPVLLGLGDH